MQRKTIITGDGSHSIAIPALRVSYHSIHGAIQESQHVFIDAGLKYVLDQPSKEQISILEVGLGTGLNALLTAIEMEKLETTAYYVALEPFPLTAEEAAALNYCHQLKRDDLQEDFNRLHESGWNKALAFTENLIVRKLNSPLQEFNDRTKFDLIFYDAFAPAAQPELWTTPIFEKLFHLLKTGGAVVTYCSKGDVRRAMIAAGFTVKKLPGPPGKREMLRATKS